MNKFTQFDIFLVEFIEASMKSFLEEFPQATSTSSSGDAAEARIRAGKNIGATSYRQRRFDAGIDCLPNLKRLVPDQVSTFSD